MKNTTSDLRTELQAFASLLDAQPPGVQEAFQLLLATAMQEAGKFELLNVAEVDDRTHYVFKSTAGEVFSVVRPGMSKEMERKVREEVRACPAGKDCYERLGLTPGRRLWYNSHESLKSGDLTCPQAPLGVLYTGSGKSGWICRAGCVNRIEGFTAAKQAEIWYAMLSLFSTLWRFLLAWGALHTLRLSNLGPAWVSDAVKSANSWPSWDSNEPIKHRNSHVHSSNQLSFAKC